MSGQRFRRRRLSRLGIASSLIRPQVERLEDRRILATITVTGLGDQVVNGDGQVTLREALAAANGDISVDGSVAGDGDDVIEFDRSLLPGRIELSLGQLLVTTKVQFRGPGAELLTIDARGGSRVLSFSGGSSTLSGLTITGGSQTSTFSAGGGISVGNGVGLSIEDSVITGNASRGDGGGISVQGSVAILNSLIVNNSADGNGGGISINTGNVLVGNSTITSNLADEGGGIGTTTSGNATILNTTIVGNRVQSLGGGILRTIGFFRVQNSIVAKNIAPTAPDFSGNGNLTEFSLIGNNSGSTNLTNGVNGNLVGNSFRPLDPLLMPLADYGGSTFSFAPHVGSPAIDAGSNLLAGDLAGIPIESDQRGAPFARISTTTVDMGSVEIGPNTFVTDSVSDDDDGNLGNRHDTLRELITEANKSPGDDTILLDSSIGDYVLDGTQLPLITDNLTIDKLVEQSALQAINVGAERIVRLAISGDERSRLIEIDDDVSITIAHVTITGGATTSDGGAILSRGNLTLDRVLLKANTARGNGGGVHAASGSVVIRDSLLTDNQAEAGGGIFLAASVADSYVINSTLSNNAADRFGGAIQSFGHLHLTNATVVENMANGEGGGVHSGSGQLELANSVVALNNALFGPDAHGSLVSIGSNLLGNNADSSGLVDGVNGNQVGNSARPLDPLLGPLHDNGGWSSTHEPLAGSPLIDRGRNLFAVDEHGTPLLNDQRHGYVPRIANSDVDIGAVEVQPSGFVVTTLADEDDRHLGLGTGNALREVLHTANVLPGSNQITFDPSLAAGVSTLGGVHLLIADDVSIESPIGANAITLDARGQSILFQSLASTEFTGLNLVNGVATPGLRGGAIYAQAGDLTISNTTIAGNQGFGGGGGIYSTAAGAIVIETSEVRDNVAGGCGAGVFSRFASVDVISSTFDGNTIDNTTAIDCFGVEGGGAIMALDESSLDNGVTIDQSDLLNNQGGTGDGGAIYSDATVSINDSTLSGNIATGTGGAIFGIAPVTISDSTISQNIGTGGGGGIYSQRPVSVSNSAINNNTSSSRGGGIYSEQSVTISNNSTVNGNRSLANHGGGLFVTGKVTISDSEISNNESDAFGGAIHLVTTTPSHSQVTNATIANNQSRLYGGGIYFQDGDLTISNSLIDANSGSLGGGIYATQNTQIGTVSILDSEFTGNQAESCGGGIRLLRMNGNIERSEVSGNHSGRGGGCVLAVPGGGGIAVTQEGTVLIKDSTVSDNTSDANGGGLLLLADTLVINTTVSGNQSSWGGGGIAMGQYEVDIVNTTITANTSLGEQVEQGGGILSEVRNNPPATVTVHNSIVANNLLDDNGTLLPNDGDGTYHSSSANNLVGVGFSTLSQGTNNTQAGTAAAPLDPRLEPLADNGGPTLTHALMSDSPAIDSGDNALAVDNTSSPLASDQRGIGFVRIAGDTVDAGAVEANASIDAYLFYNGSSFDGNDLAANQADDGAIASDKQPLLPGQTASIVNYSSFFRGLNALMIDLPSADPLISASDFVFRSGNDSDPTGWQTGPTPSVIVRPDEGAGGRDRVSLYWPDRAIANSWLQVTVVGGGNTGLVEDYVFYYGSAIGDISGEGQVDGTDFTTTRSNPKTFLDPALIDNPHDLNRDARVDATDLLIVRDNVTTLATQLAMITPTPGGGNLIAGKSVGLGMPGNFSTGDDKTNVKQHNMQLTTTLPIDDSSDPDHAARLAALVAVASERERTAGSYFDGESVALAESLLDELHIGTIDLDAI